MIVLCYISGVLHRMRRRTLPRIIHLRLCCILGNGAAIVEGFGEVGGELFRFRPGGGQLIVAVGGSRDPAIGVLSVHCDLSGVVFMRGGEGEMRRLDAW